VNLGKKMLWGGLGWALGGPIGAIIGYSFASMSAQYTTNYSGGYQNRAYPKTQPGDFIVSLLVLFGAVMKADKRMLKSELDFVKQFLSKQFSQGQVQDFMTLFKDIIKQEYPLHDVCRQIVHSMDHPSRLELIHILFGLSKADGDVHKDEVKVIRSIARYLNINDNDFNSIEAMFFRNTLSDYTILEIKSNASDSELKKAYRKMATKYHPDKVNHLGNDLRKLAEEKFKSVNKAYQNIKKERGLS
jgi:DnaJ like chaperone protein